MVTARKQSGAEEKGWGVRTEGDEAMRELMRWNYDGRRRGGMMRVGVVQYFGQALSLVVVSKYQ
jgi:hypothetical protein